MISLCKSTQIALGFDIMLWQNVNTGGGGTKIGNVVDFLKNAISDIAHFIACYVLF